MHVVVCTFEGGAFLFTTTLRTRKEFLSCQGLSRPGDRTIGALCTEKDILASANWNFMFCKSRATLARLPLCCSLLFCRVLNTHKCPAFCEGLGQCPSPSRVIQYLLVLRNARAFPLLPAALASVSFGFVLVRARGLECACGLRKSKQVLADSGGGGALAIFLVKLYKSELFVGVAHPA